MPDGKCLGSATMFPLPSRSTCQQSSMTMYWYPASFMPEATIASAICRIRSSLTLQPNLFQLFHPIGGVLANALSCADSSTGATSTTTSTTRILALGGMDTRPSLLSLLFDQNELF